jgi:hypothetical protein
MKIRQVVMAVVVVMVTAGSSLAMMNSDGGMGSGGGMGTGGSGSGMGSGMGSGGGMSGAGGMKSRMFALTMTNASLDVLAPLATPQDAVAAMQAVLDNAKSDLQISALWEYQNVYKAELADTNGQKAFDLVGEKLTGAVLPEMGYSMMMNASYGKLLQKTPAFKKHVALTPGEATAAAQAFVTKNAGLINYNLATPEAYPGFYKFHATDTLGKPGFDIMVNGYTGAIWMNTQLGLPLGLVTP